MTALDAARANIATAALERCLRITRKGGHCSRFVSRRASRVRDYNGALARFTAATPFILMLMLVAWAMSH